MDTKDKPDGRAVQILGEDKNILSFYPDTAQVKASPKEFMLLFGDTDKSHPDRNARHVKLTERIVLNPFAAKRLALQLLQVIRRHEAEFGPLKEPLPISTRLEPTPPLHPPRFKSAEGNRTVDQIFAFLAAQGIRPAFEHSFKFMRQSLFENRFLFGFEKNAIAGVADGTLSGICQNLGMPTDYVEEYRKHLPESNIVGFGFGEDAKGCVVKAYLEFGGRFFRAVRSNPTNPASYLSHLGFKWYAEDNTRKALTRYTCHPRYTYEQIMTRLANDFYKGETVNPISVVGEILSSAARRGVDRFLFLDVDEEDGHRASFDINLYTAKICLKELDCLSSLFRHYGLKREQFEAFCGNVKENVLGHLAGGRDREGKDFLTVYCGE